MCASSRAESIKEYSNTKTVAAYRALRPKQPPAQAGEAHAARGRGAGLLGEVAHAARPARPRRRDGRVSHVAHRRRKQPIGTQHLGRGLSEHQRAFHPLARAVELDQPAMVHYAVDERGLELVAHYFLEHD